ncbi:MAG: 16S rRNA (cytidine(1402)-2'-O)-methyltransferase [Chlamydiota bacterium]
MLYLVATPIGNLEDLSYRAVRILQSCDYILCEDTRKSRTLLHHYQIHKPLVSFHKFSEKKGEKDILKDLENELDIALISDAGTPLICDPGFSLVQNCIQKKIPLSAIPGASSILHALILSGFATIPFQFLGFLSKKAKAREKSLQDALGYKGTSIFFETPHRIQKTLEALQILAPQLIIAIARELTKKFEECLRDTPQNLLSHFQKHPPKGEMILLIPEHEGILCS